MKKYLALFLALAMCLSLLPLTAAAYGNQWIQMEKENFAPEEQIAVTVSGITEQMEEDSAFVSIYKKGAAHDNWGEYHYPEQGTSKLWFTAPGESGDYEMRLYRRDSSPYDAENFVTSVSFTVGKTQPKDSPAPAAGTAAPGKKDKVVLNVTIRDFKADNLLFEGHIDGGTKGLVNATLGADHKPSFILSKWQELYGANVTQNMVNSFYNDVNGTNMRTKKTITLHADDEGYYVIDSAVDEMGKSSDGYFPIDNELFGNEGNKHNYHFSTEIHATFQYKKGDEFEFVGDDDLWVFFNGKLCIDLGGVHGAQGDEISIDQLVAEGKLNIKPGDYVSFDMFHMERHLTESNMYMRTNINFINFNNSDWATFELFDAYKYDLIPAKLIDEDLALPVYRDEFAAVAVKLYEAMSGKKAEPVKVNPFTDTNDPEVLKAYNLGIVNGISETQFAPRNKLNRQEAATMLTRVYKAVKVPGWTLASDSNFKLDYKMPDKFSDDANIDAWARDSVYFMAANGIIRGLSENKFGPKNTTSAEEASGYANASREQALVISVRSFLNLK